MPKAYIGKEQAYVKHTILKAYLQRLFMIVGRKEKIINYVDCFSGPWKEKNYDLSDTSIGISLEQMARCQQSLKDVFGQDISFRALYIEKDPVAFKKLQAFLSQQRYSSVETECLNGDYTDLLDDIVSWCGNGFTFFFVDPTGWQNVVGAKTMLPLLKLGKAEFLINLMYDFVNRFVDVPAHTENMIEIFGELPGFKDESPEERQEKLLASFRSNLGTHYGGRTAFVPIEKPGKNRVLYYLVYLTRHPLGLDIFKTEAEKMEFIQRITQQEYRLRKQIQQSKTADMFGDDVELRLGTEQYTDNRLAARQFLLDRLSNVPTLIDHVMWADFLEQSDLYPGDLHLAMKGLVEEGKVENIDANISRRRKKIIRPNWPRNSERWVLI